MRTIEFIRKAGENLLKWNFATVDISYDMWDDVKEDAARRFGYSSEEYLELGVLDCLETTLNSVAGRLRKEGHLVGDNIRMLNAHGGNHEKGEWVYCDFDPGNEKSYRVLDWIREHDGKYDVLFVNSCNPGRVVLPSAKSTIVYSKDTFDSNALMRGLHYGGDEAFCVV